MGRTRSFTLCAFLFTLLQVNVLLVFSQKHDLRFTHISTEMGLSQSTVQAILKDSRGFMWFGTRDGLNKYDGSTFTVYKFDDKPGSISSNHINDLLEDKQGNIWVATKSGLNKFERSKNAFSIFNMGADTRAYIYNILQDKKGRVWLSTRSGLFQVDLITGSYKAFKHDKENQNSISVDDTRYVAEDATGSIWIATTNGLNLFDPETQTFKHYYSNPDDANSLPVDYITTVFVDSKYNVLVGAEGKGLVLYNRRDDSFVPLPIASAGHCDLSGSNVICMREGVNKQLWIGTENKGLFIYDYESKTLRCYENDPKDETTLSNNSVRHIFKDNLSDMWVGTYSNGVEFLPKVGEKFKHIKSRENGLNNNIVKAIVEDVDGNLWLATDGGGINVVDHLTHKFHYLTNDPNDSKTIGSNTSHCLLELNRDTIVFGHHRGGMDFYNKRTGKFTHFVADAQHPEKSINNHTVSSLHKDKDGNLWIGTWTGGLNFFNLRTQKFTHYKNDPDDPHSIAGNLVYTIKEDQEGRLWLGTDKGVDLFDRATQKFTHYLCDTTKDERISNNSACSMLIDSKNNIWVGTLGGGLNLMDKNKGTFTTFRQKNGLPNDIINGIVEDNRGYIWIATNKGISRLDPESMTFRNYGEEDGAQGNEFKRNSGFAGKSGRIFFGGINGYNEFIPDSIKDNPVRPAVVITDFQIFNKTVAIGEMDSLLRVDISETTELSLHYTHSLFTFKFAALNYVHPEKNQFAYMLEGFDKDWNYIGTEKKATYTNIDPGKYVFRVKACNNDGLWNEEGTAIVITIIPPFWRTWWFLSLATMAIISSVLGYIFYQRVKAKRTQASLNAIIDERTREVKAQSEEILRKYEQEKIYNWMTQGLADVGEVMSKNNSNLKLLGAETLKSVLRYVNAQQGLLAIGVKDDGEEYLEILATSGVEKERFNDKRIEVGSGTLGEVYRNKEKKILENLPKGYLKIGSGLGETMPKKVVIVPLCTQSGDVVGAMEIAFLEDVTETVEIFLDKISTLIGLNLFAVMLTHKTSVLLQQSKEQAEELRAQEEEMRQNMEELEATQEEFRRRELEYQRKIDELTSKSQVH